MFQKEVGWQKPREYQGNSGKARNVIVEKFDVMNTKKYVEYVSSVFNKVIK